MDLRTPEEIQARIQASLPKVTGQLVKVTDGKHIEEIDAGSLDIALSHGLRVATPDDLTVDKAVKESTALGTFGKHAVNQLAFGIPGVISEHDQSPLEKRKQEAIDEEHNIAALTGDVAGFAGNIAATRGLGLLGKLGQAGKAVEGAVVGGEAAGLGRTVLGGLAKGATEGALISAPKAAAQAVFADPEDAAETLMFGVGGGAAVGGIAGALGYGAKRLANFGTKFQEWKAGRIGQIAAENAEKEIAQLDSKLPQAELQKQIEAINLKHQELAKSMETLPEEAHLATKATGRLAGSVVGGVVGHSGVGGLIGHHLGEAVEPVIAPYAEKFAGKITNAAAQHVASIPDILERLSSKGFQPATLSGNVFKEFHSDHEDDKTQLESFHKFSKKLDQLNSNPELLMQQVDANANHLKQAGLDDVANAYAKKQLDTVKFLSDNIPKNPNPIVPFSNNNWQPTPKQLDTFAQQVGVVNNPYSVLMHLQQGTLTNTQVNTLKTVYPNAYQKIINKVMEHAFEPKYSNMSSGARTQLGVLLGSNLNTINSPQYAKYLQTPPPNPSGSQQPAKKSKKAPKMEIPETQTTFERISSK